MDIIRNSFKKHPYLGMIFLWFCIFLMFGRFYIESVVPLNYFGPIVMGIGVTLYVLQKRKKMDEPDKKAAEKQRDRFLLLMLGFILYAVATVYVFSLIPQMKFIAGRNPMVPFVSGLILIAGVCIYLTIRKRWNFENALIVIGMITFVMHFFYTLVTGFYVQMDRGIFFGSGDGHMGYIEYLYNHILPAQFDPREKWQYYHPPLHHYVEMIFLRCITMFGVDLRVAQYNMQFLPMLYFMLFWLTCCKFASLIGVKEKGVLIVSAIVGMTPAFVYIGNYLNNDMMSIWLSLQSIYAAAVWYKDRSFRNIIKTALIFGAGMFTKLSVWMAAVPIAVIFLTACAEKMKSKEKGAFGGWMKQMTVFVVIAAPISLYWSLRNAIRFGVPIGYVPKATDLPIDQPVLQRLFNFDWSHFSRSYLAYIEDGMPYNEYNPLIAMLKTASTGVVVGSDFSKQLYGLDFMLLWSTIVIALAAFVCMIIVLVKKKTLAPVWKIALTGLYLVNIICYYVFCIRFPNVCTEDIRYASLLIVIGAIMFGLVYEHPVNKKWMVVVQRIMRIMVIVFCTVSFLFFTCYGIDKALIIDLL